MDDREVSATIVEIFDDVLNIALTERVGLGEVGCDVSGCVHVWGPDDLVLTLDANAAFVQRAAMALLETDTPLDEEAIAEAFGELVNIVAGNLTGMLESAHFTRPVVARGTRILVPNGQRTLRGVFEDDSGGVLAYGVFPGVSTREQ